MCEPAADPVMAYRADDFHDPWIPELPAVLLHGFARNASFWRGWVPVLAARRPVLRPDLRGCGHSSHLDPTFRTDVLVADVVALLDRLGVERAHLVGESSGGLLAAYTAARHPDRVASATLVSTPVRPAGHDTDVKGAGFASTEAALREIGLDGWWMESRRRGGELTGDVARDRHHAAQLARTPLETALAMWEWIHDPAHDLLAVAPRITAPVMLACPGSSHGTTVEQQRALAAALPDGRIAVYREHNHEMYYLHAEELAGDAATFMTTGAAPEPRDAPTTGGNAR